MRKLGDKTNLLKCIKERKLLFCDICEKELMLENNIKGDKRKEEGKAKHDSYCGYEARRLLRGNESNAWDGENLRQISSFLDLRRVTKRKTMSK